MTCSKVMEISCEVMKRSQKIYRVFDHIKIFLPHTGWRHQCLSLCVAAWNHFSAAAQGYRAAVPKPSRSGASRDPGNGVDQRTAASLSSRRQTAHCPAGRRTAWLEHLPLCRTHADEVTTGLWRRNQTVSEAERRSSAPHLPSSWPSSGTSRWRRTPAGSRGPTPGCTSGATGAECRRPSDPEKKQTRFEWRIPSQCVQHTAEAAFRSVSEPIQIETGLLFFNV